MASDGKRNSQPIKLGRFVTCGNEPILKVWDVPEEQIPGDGSAIAPNSQIRERSNIVSSAWNYTSTYPNNLI
jgi:hypothetical protein